MTDAACICGLLEEEPFLADYGGPFTGEYTPWFVSPNESPHRDLLQHDHRCPEAAKRIERAAVVRYLRFYAGLLDEPARGHIAFIADRVDNGEHHSENVTVCVPHYATLHEAHGPSSNPPDSEASADSCERKGGTASPDTSG
jgi:hypothetical protein